MLKKKHLGTTACAALALSVLAPLSATAHPDHGQSQRELFPGEGVASAGYKQHGEVSGHLPGINENMKVVGAATVSNPSGSESSRGRVADVSAYGDYAYLTSFRSENCLGGGAWVVDMSDPTNPVEEEFLPTTPGSYAGEGSQVFTPKYGAYKGKQLFLHQNETCDAEIAEEAKPGAPNVGGINIWDVTDPDARTKLVEHAGDYDDGTDEPRQSPTTVHSMFAWNSHVDKKSYVVLVDNEELADVDIMDITDPTAPVMVNDTLDLAELFGVDQESPDNLTSVFNHDMTVKRVGSRYVMNVNYWDGGYVLLDVTDPTPDGVSLITESDFAALDEERLKRDHEISPEGNAHQSEFSPDNRFMVGTDEDFNPYRVFASISDGEFAGYEFSAASASGTPALTPDTPISGSPDNVGLACEPLEAVDGGIALIERGTCAFQVKLDTITAAGYDGGIVFNAATDGCEGFISMLADGDIPFVFVQRSTGLRLLGVAPEGDAACTTATPADATSAGVDIRAEFDGWGYVRLFRTDFSTKPDTTGSIRQVDTFALPQSQKRKFAEGFGDLSVHEVAMDPRQGKKLAYLSYYSGGVRVLEYGKKGLTEVGAFIDEEGSNVWGIEVHKMKGKTYLLASDRDRGLYILKYTGKSGKKGGRG